jgi:hypothetical protein
MEIKRVDGGASVNWKNILAANSKLFFISPFGAEHQTNLRRLAREKFPEMTFSTLDRSE